jgi:imidazolonepropionase-like amidohydrolase
VLPLASLDTGTERIDDAAVVVEAGRITAWGRSAEITTPTGARDLRTLPAPIKAVLRTLHATLPLVDGNSQRGAAGPLRELPLAPGLSALDACDPFASGFAEARAAGVGHIVFAPDVDAVLAGKAGLLSLGERYLGLEARREVALVGSLAASALEDLTGPASRDTARRTIERMLDDAHAQVAATTSGDQRSLRPDRGALRAVSAGEITLVLRVATRGDVRCALALFAARRAQGEHLRGAMLAPASALSGLARELARAEVGIVHDPLTLEASDRELGLPSELARAGVHFCFSSRAPAHLESGLIDQAALAVVAGLTAAQAWQALTNGATAVYRLPLVTQLAAGAVPPLVLWQGDPRSFRCRPVAWLDDTLTPQALIGALQRR